MNPGLALPRTERMRSRVLHNPWIVFLVFVLLGMAVRLGYGIVKYRPSLLLTGPAFIQLWDFDGLEHVLIAKSLIDDQTYAVASIAGLESKHVRAVGQDAVFKAPLYEFFLAGVFRLSGFNFSLFFPLQALFGGMLAGLMALIALECFEAPGAPLVAGTAAALHPVLVNSAAQPYNENLFFALLFASVWLFLMWLRTGALAWSVSCGILGGFAVLCRETAVPLFLVMLGFALLAPSAPSGRLRATAVMALCAGLAVAPWAVRNHVRESALIPVASNIGSAVGIGNNACVAEASVLTPYEAEGPCPALDAERSLLRQQASGRLGTVVSEDRIYGTLGVRFVLHHPVDYARLTLRRLWTLPLPFHPKHTLGAVQQLAMVLYWLAIVPGSVAGMWIGVRRLNARQILLVLLIGATLAPLALIYFSPDMRYRVGAELLMACFAGWIYTGGRSASAPHPGGR
jgi:dolichyl-phosphate-mannose-protein mannosyltransferase